MNALGEEEDSNYMEYTRPSANFGGSLIYFLNDLQQNVTIWSIGKASLQIPKTPQP